MSLDHLRENTSKNLNIFVPARDVTSFYSLIKDIIAKIPSFALATLVLITSFVFFINNITIVYDGLYDDHHFAYYIMLSVHTSACLLLLINVIGVFKQSRRAILFVMISLVLIFSATIYTYIFNSFIMDFINIYITYSRLSSF